MCFKFTITTLFLIASFVCSAAGTNTSATASGMCNDGSFFYARKKQGACTGHKGVKNWYTPSAIASAGAPSVASKQVWVNVQSRIFHCPGSRWYGKTKNGIYMSETTALAKDYKPARNSSCIWQNARDK